MLLLLSAVTKRRNAEALRQRMQQPVELPEQH